MAPTCTVTATITPEQMDLIADRFPTILPRPLWPAHAVAAVYAYGAIALRHAWESTADYQQEQVSHSTARAAIERSASPGEASG